MTDTAKSLPELANETLAHLNNEVEALTRVRNALENLRQNMRNPHLPTLQAVRAEQEAALADLEQVRARRADLLDRLGRALKTPNPRGILRKLASQFPAPVAHELDTAREQTRQLALQVDALNQRTALLASCCLHFVQNLLAEMSGDPGGPRYSAAGKVSALADIPSGSLLEAQG